MDPGNAETSVNVMTLITVENISTTNKGEKLEYMILIQVKQSTSYPW
jgi:hypothetical protein